MTAGDPGVVGRRRRSRPRRRSAPPTARRSSGSRRPVWSASQPQSIGREQPRPALQRGQRADREGRVAEALEPERRVGAEQAGVGEIGERDRGERRSDRRAAPPAARRSRRLRGDRRRRHAHVAALRAMAQHVVHHAPARASPRRSARRGCRRRGRGGRGLDRRRLAVRGRSSGAGCGSSWSA